MKLVAMRDVDKDAFFAAVRSDGTEEVLKQGTRCSAGRNVDTVEV